MHCHASCSQDDVIAAMKEKGLWDGRRRFHLRPVSRREEKPLQQDQQQAKRTAVALSIWRSTLPAAGTLVEAYLAARGLTLTIPPSIRFHRSLKHPSGQYWPGMVALVMKGDDGTPLAIHRTFLARDGSGKAPVHHPRMMLGPCGGGAVRLGQLGEVLMVGEGLETCLSAMQATGYPAWAALSTSGLKTLELPQTVRDVIVLADGEDAGETAARKGALRWVQQGRRVRIARPPRGIDFNDMLLGGVTGTKGGVR